LIARLGVRTGFGDRLGVMRSEVSCAERSSMWHGFYGRRFAMGAGVAVMQGNHAAGGGACSRSASAFTTAVYTNGLLIGRFARGVMLPLVLPLVGNWQRGFVVWSVRS